MLNSVSIMGRLARDPELRVTNNGTNVVSFTIACERDFGQDANGKKVTDFFDVVAWRQTADFIKKYFAKGRMIVVEGSLQARVWEDDSGNKRKTIEVVASHAYFGDSKRDDQPGAYPAPSAPAPAPDSSGFIQVEDDDLPF